MRYEVASDSCWNWLGYVDRNGYGWVNVWGRETPAHRAAYELLNGPIPVDFQIHHRCRNRRCINPEHLEALPVEEHTHVHPHNQPRDTCIWGHPFDEENTYVRANGERQCRKCKARRERERQRRLRAEQGIEPRFEAMRQVAANSRLGHADEGDRGIA